MLASKLSAIYPVALSFFVTLGIHAQNATDEIDEDEVETLIVTGSHIKVAADDEALPVTRLSRDDLALEGAPSTLDLMRLMLRHNF